MKTASLQKKVSDKASTDNSTIVNSKADLHECHSDLAAGIPSFLQRFVQGSRLPSGDDDSHLQIGIKDPAKKRDREAQFSGVQVASPDDEYEKEAESMAEKVMRRPEPSPVQDDLEFTQKPYNGNPTAVSKSRQLPDTEQQTVAETDASILQTANRRIQSKAEGRSVINPSLPSNNTALLSPGGSPLPVYIRKRIEPHLGHNLRHVRVHNDTHAHNAARAIRAKAFTLNSHVYLGKGQRTDDLQLMAHECIHVVQQAENKSISRIQRFIIPEELMSCVDHRALSSRQLNSRLEIVESTLSLFDYSSPDYLMLEEERTRILNELSRPERSGPESAPAEEGALTRWTRPPAGISTARNLRIVANPERHPVVVGTTVRYWYDYHHQMTIRSADSPAPPPYVREVVQNWTVTDPSGNERDRGDEREIEVQLNLPGRWEIGIEVRVADGTHHLWYQHDVIRPSDIARERMAGMNAEDFLHFRARLEQERLRLEHFSEWGAVNTNRERPYITCSQPNPVAANSDPDHIYHRYEVHPSTAGSRFKWYVRAANWEHSYPRMSYRRAYFGEAGFGDYPGAPSDIEFWRQDIDGEHAWVRSGYLNTSFSVFTFIANHPGRYTIVCEELASDGTPAGPVARYIQIVTTPQEMRQIEAIRRHIRLTDENIDKIAQGAEAPVKAVYVNNETGNAMYLSMYIGQDKDDEDTIKLLDLTPGVGRMEYDGDSVSDALDTFGSGNAYPVGIIHLEIPPNEAGIQPLSRRFDTTGSSDWSDWASGTGWTSLTLGVLGVIATIAPIPGSRVIAGICFVGAAAAGGVSAGLSLYERLQQAEIDETGVAIDVLSIASSIIGGASAFRALRYGATVAIGTRVGRYLLWAGFSTDLAAGVLLTIQGVNEINRIMESDAPRGDKIGSIVRILATLALNGGLLVLSVRDLRTARGRIGEHIQADLTDVSPDIIHRLNLLDNEALRAIRGASLKDLERIAHLVSINRDAANKLTQAIGRDVLDHTVEAIEGQIRINNQLDIHPSRLVQIENADLAVILRATAETPVNVAALRPFTRSGSYRLRFRFQLIENENWLRRVIDDAGLTDHPEARRLLANLDDVGRIRLQEARTGAIPRGVRDQLESRATQYAISQRPGNAREFVNHYEMFISEYNRRRNLIRESIQQRIEALIQSTPGMQRGQANRQAAREILGDEIEGFSSAFNRAILEGPSNLTSASPYRGLADAEVSHRASELAAQLRGRAGPRRLGLILDSDSLGRRIQRMSNLQFGSESAAIYHTNKHGAELPNAHLTPTYANDPISRYLKSANETIQGGQAQVFRNQDGSYNVTVTRRYGTIEMRAILRVSENGRVVIATYGKV